MLVLARPEYGGTYQYTLSMLEGLRHAQGFEVTLFGDPQNPDFLKTGYPITPFAESHVQQLFALVTNCLHIPLPDPFASQDVMLAPIYSASLLLTTTPFAYALHDLQERYYPENFFWWQRVWRNRINRALLVRAGRVICESRYVKGDIIRFFSVPEDRITVIPAPPQPQFLLAQSEDQLNAARLRLRLPEAFVVYPAQFWPHKNHLRLIEAFRGVVNEASDLKLVLTGRKRDDYQTVMECVARLGLEQHVLHLGPLELDDLQAVYQLATALVMPSLFESVSIPIYEAFQLGIPVAASGILAIPEQVGDAAVLFDPTSVHSIRDAILDIIRNPQKAREFGQRGQKRMAEITSERYGTQLQELLRELQA